MRNIQAVCVLMLGLFSCSVPSPAVDTRGASNSGQTAPPPIGTVGGFVQAAGNLMERLERVITNGITQLGDVAVLKDRTVDDTRDWSVIVVATPMESTDQFHARFALAITIIDHASIIAEFHASPKDLRNKIDY